MGRGSRTSFAQFIRYFPCHRIPYQVTLLFRPVLPLLAVALRSKSYTSCGAYHTSGSSNTLPSCFTPFYYHHPPALTDATTLPRHLSPVSSMLQTVRQHCLLSCCWRIVKYVMISRRWLSRSHEPPTVTGTRLDLPWI